MIVLDDSAPKSQFDWLGLMRLLLLVGLATLMLPSLVPGSHDVAAQDRSVEWRRFDVTIDLREDGSYHIAERQEIDFQGGPFRTGFANIPLARTEGITNVTIAEIVDGEEDPLRRVTPSSYAQTAGTYTSQTTTSEIQIEWAFDPVRDDTRTFLLEYDVAGALRVYLDSDPPGQEISWFVVGAETTEIGPVNESTVTINLPVAVDPAQTEIRPWDDPAAQTTDGQQWIGTVRNLTAGDSFEVGLRFPPIVPVGPPSWQQADDARSEREEEIETKAAWYNVLLLGLGGIIAVGGGLGVFGLWYTRGRDPHTGLVADFLPTPPDNLPPGAAGTLLDERANEHDIVATLVDLGHRQVIKIEEVSDDGFLGFGGSTDFTLTMLTPDAELAPFERDLLNAIFGAQAAAGMTQKLSEINQRFVAAQPVIRQHLYDEVVKRGYFTHSPEATRSRWRSAAIAIGVLGIIGGCVASSLIGDVAPLVWVPIAVVVGLALVLAALSAALPRKTVAGAEATAKWRAFRKYLSEIERFEKLDEAKEIFDRYLPYAIAFGLERSWVAKFAAVETPSPQWYGGGGGGSFGRGIGETWSSGPGRGRSGGGTVIFPGGGWGDGGAGGGNANDGGGSTGGGGFDIPDLQETSDRAGRSLQSSSDSLFDLLNTAARTFGGSSGGGGWGGGGGFGGGFGGGGSRGGGGGSRGFG